MTEQYCLRWNNHQSTVVSVFENLLESGSLIDCTLCAEGKLMKAHKVVLSACSSVFESMLCQHGGDKHPIIFLKDVRFDELKAMVDYMYRGEANVHQELLDSFLKTAASLQIKGLTDQGGGGNDEPPPKKGPGVNANRSKPPPPLDATPESSREGSISPTLSRKRRRPTTNNMAGSGGLRRPSSEDASADNSCDTLPLSSAQNVSAAPPYQAASTVASTPSQPLPQSSQSLMEPARVTIKKQEPLDQTPQSMIQPKTEFIDESNEDVEDLTLDDDDDYNDSMSEMSKPGTSYSMQQPSQDFQWSQMMGGNDSRSGAEEVFMQQDSVNNQGNTQVKKRHLCVKCNRTYGRRDHLTRHWANSSCGGGENYSLQSAIFCNVCGKQFSRKDHLVRHKKRSCGRARKYHCSMCEHVTENKKHLVSHMLVVHGVVCKEPIHPVVEFARPDVATFERFPPPQQQGDFQSTRQLLQRQGVEIHGSNFESVEDFNVKIEEDDGEEEDVKYVDDIDISDMDINRVMS